MVVYLETNIVVNNEPRNIKKYWAGETIQTLQVNSSTKLQGKWFIYWSIDYGTFTGVMNF